MRKLLVNPIHQPTSELPTATVTPSSFCLGPHQEYPFCPDTLQEPCNSTIFNSSKGEGEEHNKRQNSNSKSPLFKGRKGPNRKSPVPTVVKDLQKFYIKGRSSFQNAWTALLNFDLLEESCVEIQTFGLECKRSENKTHISSNFNLSPIKISDSNINLVRGTLHSASNITNSGEEKLDDEVSIIGTSTEELEPFNLEERDDAYFKANNLDDALGLDLPKLFLTPEPKVCIKELAESFPAELVPFIAACGIDLI